MDESSTPSSSSCFDPALCLHSDPAAEPQLPPSTSNSDDLEALHLQQQELTEAKTKAGIVIQHRIWGPDDVLRSEDVFSPETPTKPRTSATEEVTSFVSTRAERIAQPPSKMPFSSSPVLYPPSSSPPVIRQKRKLFQSLEHQVLKRSKADDRAWNGECDIRNDVAKASASAPSPEPEPPLVQADSALRSPSLPPLPQFFTQSRSNHAIGMQTCSGKHLNIPQRRTSQPLSYEQTVAQRSVSAAGRAKKAYYGIEIHQLLDDAACQAVVDKAQMESRQNSDQVLKSIEQPPEEHPRQSKDKTLHQMWTEKYRARKFTDLIGDERTHRAVLRWLKAWDTTVFPGSEKPMTKRFFKEGKDGDDRQQLRKILLLTGPPGLGKTTLAHVCARQAGYEVLEINASDDRSRDVVKGRIKDALGTETVRGIKEQNKARKAGRPVCVVVDEVDGVVSGSSTSGGEGGFMKALIDLVQLDQRNSTQTGGDEGQGRSKKGKESRFKLKRPLILVCNDVYAPSLRPLRNSSVAEIVHVRKPPIDKVISRLKSVFEKENIHCDGDAIRRLCESTWGLGSRKQGGANRHGAGEGDIRSVLVQGEWIAHKIRATVSLSGRFRLTRNWLDANILHGDGQTGSSSRGLGRGGTREVVERVFLEGAGLPNLPTTVSPEEARLLSESRQTPKGVADLRKRAAINSLREMVDTCGDHDRLMTDCFAAYPTQVFQDDTCLSKPNAGYEWLAFHDRLSSRIFGGQEWELNPYLSSAVCAFHHLFAGVEKGSKVWDENNHKEEEDIDEHPFSGPKADFAAFEALKQKQAVFLELQNLLSAPLLRLFRSTDALATELMPNLVKMVAPDVKPIVVGGSGGQGSVASVRKESEKNCVKNSVRVLTGLNISFEKIRVEIEGGGAHSNGGFVYRMEP